MVELVLGFFFFLVDFDFFGSAVDFVASADLAGVAAIGAAGAAAGAAIGAGALAGAAGGVVCAKAVSANALAIKAVRSLLICRFFRG